MADMKKVKEGLNCLKKDFEMLLDGSWDPSGGADAANDSIEVVEEIAKELNIELEEQ